MQYLWSCWRLSLLQLQIAIDNHIRMQAIKKTTTIREKFLHLTHTNPNNNYIIKYRRKWACHKVTMPFTFHTVQLVLQSPNIHAQVSKSVTNILLLFLHTIAFAVFFAAFGQGTGPVLLGYVRCTGTESSLLSCSHRAVYCLHFQDAGVVCPPCKSCI